MPKTRLLLRGRADWAGVACESGASGSAESSPLLASLELETLVESAVGGTRIVKSAVGNGPDTRATSVEPGGRAGAASFSLVCPTAVASELPKKRAARAKRADVPGAPPESAASTRVQLKRRRWRMCPEMKGIGFREDNPFFDASSEMRGVFAFGLEGPPRVSGADDKSKVRGDERRRFVFGRETSSMGRAEITCEQARVGSLRGSQQSGTPAALRRTPGSMRQEQGFA